MDKYDYNNISAEEQEKLFEIASNEEKQKDCFEKIREKIDKYVKEHPNAKIIDYLLIVPDLFYLLCKLYSDNRIEPKKKVNLAIAIVYCISPIDFIPDILAFGYTDDLLLIIKTLLDLIGEIDEEIIKEHWTGDDDIIKVINEMAKTMSDILSKENIVPKIQMFINKFLHKND